MGVFSSVFGSLFDSQPAVNIDGAPMIGDVDIHGNPYGVTEIDHGTNDSLSSDTTSIDIGGDSSLFDTSSSFATDDSSSSMSISSEDSFSSFGSDDSFGNDFSSCDTFSSNWDD